MKKLWKILGVAAAAAALVPCKVEKDEETGKKTYQSLLSRVKVGPDKDGVGTKVQFDMLGGVLFNGFGGKEGEVDVDEDDFDDSLLEQEPIAEISVTISRDVPAQPEEAEADEAQAAAEAMKAEAKAEEQAAAEAMEAEAKAEEQAAGAEMSRELSETPEI